MLIYHSAGGQLNCAALGGGHFEAALRFALVQLLSRQEEKDQNGKNIHCGADNTDPPQKMFAVVQNKFTPNIFKKGHKSSV